MDVRAVLSRLVISDSATPQTIVCQGPLSMEFWSGKNTGVVAIPCSRVSSQPRDWNQVSHVAGRIFNILSQQNIVIGKIHNYSDNQVGFSVPRELTLYKFL